jgi:hypothetical protein
MKKLILICCWFSIVGCEKSILDYRSKFIGDYHFSIHRTTWLMGVGTTSDSTFTYEGSIGYGSDNNIIIYCYANCGIEAHVYEDGTLEYRGHPDTYLDGEFSSVKEIQLYYSTGGLGGRENLFVEGEKK